MRFGHTELSRSLTQLVHLILAVVRRPLGGGAWRRDAEPPGDQVGDALGHQAIGRDLDADDAGRAGDAIPRLVVDHGEVAAHLATLGLGAEVVEGPHAGIGTHGARGSHAVEHLRPFIDQQPPLVPLDGQYLGVRNLDRRRSEDGHAQTGNDDVAVARLVAAVDGRVRQATREDDHYALDRNDLHLDIEQPGDEPGPRAGRVDHRLAADARLLAGYRVASQHP